MWRYKLNEVNKYISYWQTWSLSFIVAYKFPQFRHATADIFWKDCSMMNILSNQFVNGYGVNKEVEQ